MGRGEKLTTISKPVQLSQSPPLLLSFQLIPGHLLLLFLLLHQLGQTIRDIIHRSIRPHTLGWSSRARNRTGGTGHSPGCTNLASHSGSGSGGVVKGVFDEGDFTLVGKHTGVNVPDFGTEGSDEFGRVRDDADGTSPFFDSDSETTEGFSVQEVGRFVEEETLRSRSKAED